MASTSPGPWSRLSLQAKIFVLSLLLVVGLTGTLLVFSFQRAESLAMDSLQTALAGTRSLYGNLQRDRLQKLSLINSVIAEAPYFKAAVAEMDPATTLDSAQTMVEQVGSDFMIVTDYEGTIVARTDQPDVAGVNLSDDPLVGYALEGDEVGGVWLEDGRLYHAVSVPLIFGPELIGTIVSGYEIGDGLAQDIKNFANCEVAFLASTEVGFLPTGSTLANDTPVLASWLQSQPVESAGNDIRVDLSGETYQAVFAPLETADDESVGVMVALRSRDRELAPFRSFQQSVLLAGVAGLVLAGLASHLLAKGLAKPIQQLVEVTYRIRDGDYDSEVQVRSQDEIGKLAGAFKTLLGELREKRTMEKFISQSAAEMIQRTDSAVQVGGERMPVTVLFSDLKVHSVLKSETSDTSMVLGKVNQALSREADLVERYGGSVDKFVGDRMMAVFKGAERVWPAIRCAISIQHLMETGDTAADALVPSIGISAGEAVFGAVGSDNRLDYTLLGPAVHVADRLASDARPGEVLLAEDAYTQVKDRASVEPLRPISFQGFDKPIGVYSLSTGTLRQSQIQESRATSGDSDATMVPGGATLTGVSPGEAIPLSALEPGTVLGRYEIRRVLGSGGMGMVFQAHDRELDEPLALKVLRPEIATEEPGILDRFKTEIRVARRITHRNIVRTFDFGEASGIRFITMEFVQGMTLKKLIRSRGRLPLRVGLQIAKQASAGLVAAHEADVVHRDVKPQNIMITQQSEVKIMDFGIVRDRGKTSTTQTGMVMGTPDYMSPEQAQGKEDLDQRSDIYSLGVVLYEMFTGVLPFKGENPFSVAMKHIKDVPREPREIQEDIPADLQAVIMRCMEKEPDRRYAQMSHLQADLYRISGG